MKTVLLLCLFTLYQLAGYSQQDYNDSIHAFIRNYVAKHEVVTGGDRQYLQFFNPDPSYRVVARFEKTDDSKWFSMETSGTIKKVFRVYGVLHFSVHDTLTKLNLYQSQDLMQVEKYKEHLFLPFTDQSSGESTYAAGRYLDVNRTDIANNSLVLDFNKAYNPYCAYVSGVYNCPIPPRENQLPVIISAGEKNYSKAHQ